MDALLSSLQTGLLKGNTAIQQRWKEHFERLLNRESMVTDDTILSIPQHPERASLDIPPTWKEVQLATMQMKNNKASQKELVDNIKIHEPLGNSDHNQIHFDINVKSESKNKKRIGETSIKVTIKI